MTVAPLNTFGTRAVWEWVAMIGSQSFTGEVRLATQPAVVLFASRGEIYWAEQDCDPPLADRLISVGAIQPQQLERGAVRLRDIIHLGRLFDRDPSVDRHVAELAVELLRDDLLERMAMRPTEVDNVAPLRLHPSGIHRWFQFGSTAGTGTTAPQDSEPEPEAEPGTTDPDVTTPVAAPSQPAVESRVPQSTPVVQFDFDRAFAPLNELQAPRLASNLPAQPTTPTAAAGIASVAIDPTPSQTVPIFTAAPIPLTTNTASPSLTELWSMADTVLPTVDDKDYDHG